MAKVLKCHEYGILLDDTVQVSIVMDSRELRRLFHEFSLVSASIFRVKEFNSYQQVAQTCPIKMVERLNGAASLLFISSR
jgi:hypothetical protein